jgi:hypothetical protein
MRRITIMSGPIRFMILAIVIGIKKSRICLFRKKVVQRSIHSYRIRKVIFQESNLPHGIAARRGEVDPTSPFFKNWGIKIGVRRLYQMNATVHNQPGALYPQSGRRSLK